ncbi:hypothetical protein PCANC_24789 [Puccinia coronata f. sp. avenae]|uniref:J domain-containing protein n=1 Tax=Puccinia coronata f. sp. avenae TaxID=200324 RepID=A0A2N5S2P3_9BASI|nr:hypothetical protein PCANC_24789 [Puccinia coronata f. sp. avenae]
MLFGGASSLVEIEKSTTTSTPTGVSLATVARNILSQDTNMSSVKINLSRTILTASNSTTSITSSSSTPSPQPTRIHPRMPLSSSTRSYSAVFASATTHQHHSQTQTQTQTHGSSGGRRRLSPPGSQPPARSSSHQPFTTTTTTTAHSAANKPPKPRSADPDPHHHRNNNSNNNNSPYDLVDQINRHNDLYHVLGFTGYSYYARGQIHLEDIRKAYISRSRLCHPDKLPQYQPCTAAFQKLSFAYETLSKPASRKLYDLSGQTDQAFSFESRPPGRPTSSYNPRKPSDTFASAGRPFHHSAPPNFGPRPSPGFNADDTLNGVLHATFCEFMDGDFEMIRVVINALNEGNPGLNLGEDVVASLEGVVGRLRSRVVSGKKYVGLVRFELMKLYELQASLRALSYFNLLGRLRLSLALARVTLSIPMQIDQAMRAGSSDSDSDLEDDDQDNHHETDGEAKKPRERKGILPPRVVGLLEATVAVLERGERATLWPSSSTPHHHVQPSSTAPSNHSNSDIPPAAKPGPPPSPEPIFSQPNQSPPSSHQNRSSFSTRVSASSLLFTLLF